MTKIEEYSKEIPEEIRRAIRGLDSDYRAAIFVALYKHGELSFSELQKTLEMDKANLNYHLKTLTESALVHHYYKHELGTEKYSFYHVTPFGQDFVEILSQFLRPQPCLLAPQESTTASRIFISNFPINAHLCKELDTEVPLEDIIAYIWSKPTRDHATDIFFAANDTNIGSAHLRVRKRAKEETVAEGSFLSSTV